MKCSRSRILFACFSFLSTFAVHVREHTDNNSIYVMSAVKMYYESYKVVHGIIDI